MSEVSADKVELLRHFRLMNHFNAGAWGTLPLTITSTGQLSGVYSFDYYFLSTQVN